MPSDDSKQSWLRVSGAKFRRIAERAERVAASNDPYELDLAEAVSRTRFKRKGRGWQMFIPLTPDEMDRIAEWFPERDRAAIYDAADDIRNAR